MTEFDVKAVDLRGLLNTSTEEKAKQVPDPATYHILCMLPKAEEEIGESKPAIPIDPSALKHLEGMEFPGNIRELENMIERAIVIGNGKKITLKDLPLEKNSYISTVESLNEQERIHILQILNKYDWNISRSAKALQVDRVTLYNKIKKYNLKSTNK